jgi:ATP-dependent helicase HrpB
LWSKLEQDERSAQELPEVKRLDLSDVVLTLKAADVRDLRKFRWLESPGDAAISHAEELLADLGALENSAGFTGITALGRRMLAFPIHPRYARMLIAAQEYDCVYEACLVAALTQGRDLVLRKTDRSVESSREDLFGDIVDDGLDFRSHSSWQFARRRSFASCTVHSIHGMTLAGRSAGSVRIARMRTSYDPWPTNVTSMMRWKVRSSRIRRPSSPYG